MKSVIIGDIHGRDVWKHIVHENCDADEFVFVGDYFDSHVIRTERIVSNFIEILNFQYKNPEKVTLLVGNHDFQYLDFARNSGQTCSGYDNEVHVSVGPMLVKRVATKKMLVTTLVQGEYLVSHAGVSVDWWNNTSAPEKGSIVNLVDRINAMLCNKLEPKAFLFSMKDTSGYGEHVEQGPLWIRPHSLARSAIMGVNQIVGHTKHDRVMFQNVIRASPKPDLLCFVDTLGSGEYLTIEDGVACVNKVKSPLF